MLPHPASSSIRRRPRRALEEILGRQQSRQRDWHEILAPDMMHGALQISSIYDTCAAAWVEQAAFVVCMRDACGAVTGYTVGRFDDYFLTVEQALDGEVVDLQAWLAARLVGRGTVISLTLLEGKQSAPVTASHSLIPIRCDRDHLSALERAHLGVTRDVSHAAAARGDRDALWLMGQADCISLIGLCHSLMDHDEVYNNVA